MAKFFGSRHGRSRSRRSEAKESGLSDKTNFPLLSSRWMRGSQDTASTTNFSARRMLCFADPRAQSHAQATSPPEYVKTDPKAVSPSQDVASTWMQMGSSVSSSSSSSTGGSAPCEQSRLSRQPANRTRSSNSRIRDGASRSSATAVGHTSSSSTRRLSAATSRRPGGGGGVATSHQPHRPSRDSTLRHTMKVRKPVSKSSVQSEWRSAVDPKSGRTYYYNVRTRETQWRKPMELASPEERSEMENKEKKQKDFFAVMEANMLKQLATGQVPGTPKVSPSTAEIKQQQPSAGPKKLSIQKPRMVRTISAMDDQILRELVKRAPSLNTSGTKKKTKMNRDDSIGMEELNRIHDEMHLSDISEESLMQISTMDMSAMEFSLADLNPDDMMDTSDSPSTREENHAIMELAKTAEQMAMASEATTRGSLSLKSPDALEKKLPPSVLKRPSLMDTRRNTCGTMYVGSTMSAPDKDATIKCVCGVYRAHILSAATERSSLSFVASDKYRIFNDREQDRLPAGTVREDVVMEDLSEEDMIKSVPSLDDITNFYRDVFRRAQMESDCIIMSLIYVERLIKSTDGGLRPRPSNWRSLLFSCMILSSKVWDDLSMWNADFSQTCPAGVRFSLQRINELELAVLNALDYKVKVPASEYAKYYFLLRSMLIKSGLGGDDIKTMTPLDVEGAKKLEQVSSSFQSTAATKRRVAKEDKLRSKSMGDVDVAQLMQGAQKSQEKKASLEQIVHM